MATRKAYVGWIGSAIAKRQSGISHTSTAIEDMTGGKPLSK